MPIKRTGDVNMANEAVIVELLGNKGDPIRFTIADNTAGNDTAKGTIMELLDNRTVQAVSAADVPVVGILAEEKVGGDGQTSVGVFTNGIFQLTATTTQLEIGDTVKPADGANKVMLAASLDDEKGFTLGYALETTAPDATGMVRVVGK